MTWTDRRAPSLADFAALARDAFAGLPDDVRRQAGEVALRVDDFASEAVLDDLGIADPFELTGRRQSDDPALRSLQGSSPRPSTMSLYRRPILDEWCERGDVALGDLIAHVLVDELGADAEPSIGVREGWAGAVAPTLDDFAEIAGVAVQNLPPAIRSAVGDIQIRIEDFADDETLDALEIDDPFELTGVYEGVDLTRRSVFDAMPSPSSIRLFRRPILDEWSEGEVGFRSLVEHVLVHEIAHHFGFSDAGIEHVEHS